MDRSRPPKWWTRPHHDGYGYGCAPDPSKYYTRSISKSQAIARAHEIAGLFAKPYVDERTRKIVGSIREAAMKIGDLGGVKTEDTLMRLAEAIERKFGEETP